MTTRETAHMFLLLNFGEVENELKAENSLIAFLLFDVCEGY